MSNNSNQYKLNSILKDFQRGFIKEAFIKIEEYIKIYPNDLIAKYNYAVILEKLHNKEKAKLTYQYIIKKNPNHWQSLTNLYLINFDKSLYEESLPLVNKVLNIKPNYQSALRDKSHILYRLNKLDEALKNIIVSLKLNPNDYIALNIMGMICNGLKDREIAKKMYRKAISIKPNYAPTYSNMAKSYIEENNKDQSIIYLNKCLEIDPNFKEGINNLANIYTTTGSPKKAIPLYLNVLSKNKSEPDVNLNIAIAYFFDKNYDLAKKYFEITEKLIPNNDKFKKNFSLFLLFKQNYKKAWDIGDGRLNLQEYIVPGTWLDNFKDKVWRGEKITNEKNILIIKEQGVGDEILYSTMYLEALKFFPNCLIETEERLLTLFKRSYNKDKIIPFLSISKNKEKLKKIDKVIFSASLTRFFRNNKKDFITKSSLKIDKNLEAETAYNLKKISIKKKIGITWKSKREFLGESKSINIESFLPILKLSKDFDFINLQYGDVEEDLIKLKEKNIELIDLNVDLFNDFEKIAAILKNLDLFITVSNSTAHLAGALNVKTWLIKPKTFALFHYWNQPNFSCPWYPSIRLIEQNKNVDEIINDLKNDLILFKN